MTYFRFKHERKISKVHLRRRLRALIQGVGKDVLEKVLKRTSSRDVPLLKSKFWFPTSEFWQRGFQILRGDLYCVALRCVVLFLVVPGCFWLLLVASGCFWLFLVVLACSGLCVFVYRPPARRARAHKKMGEIKFFELNSLNTSVVL